MILTLLRAHDNSLVPLLTIILFPDRIKRHFITENGGISFAFLLQRLSGSFITRDLKFEHSSG